MSNEAFDFQDTLVAFFDIQGYSAFVANNSQEEVVSKSRALILSNLHTAQTDMFGIRFESFALSDSLIIVVNTKRRPIIRGSVHFLLATCSSILAQSLAMYEMPLRGAIGSGWFHMEKDVLASSALVDAAKFERLQNWYGMVVTPCAETAFLTAYGDSESGFLSHNNGFIKRGTIPWKKGSEELHKKANGYFYVQPFEAYFDNRSRFKFPIWFDQDSEKIKNSKNLYLKPE